MSDHEIKTGEVERRFVPVNTARVEVRESEDRKGIGGVAIPTGVSADIGRFTEEIAPEAVRHAIEEGWDVRGLFNHDPNLVLARTKSGTMELRASKKGMEFDIPEMPSARADVLEAVERGDVDGNSFSFNVAVEEWDEGEEDEKPHRTIKRFSRLFDLGPVTFPAYEGQTVVSTRALDHVRRVETAFAARVIPENVSTEIVADRDVEWSVPALSDFTDDSWGDLSDSEKLRIAGHYTWAPQNPPENFTGLALPHHRPSDGRVVWRGLVAAAQRLGQTDVPEEDVSAIQAHLGAHYEAFGETAPWDRSADVGGLAVRERKVRAVEAKIRAWD